MATLFAHVAIPSHPVPGKPLPYAPTVAHTWLWAPVLGWNKGGQEGCWVRQSREAACSIPSLPDAALHWDGACQVPRGLRRVN